LTLFAVAGVLPAQAATIWTGPDLVVTQPDGAGGTVTDVLVTGVDSLGRAASGTFCNALAGQTCPPAGINTTDITFAFSGFNGNPVFAYGSAGGFAAYTFDSAMKNSLDGAIGPNLPPNAPNPVVGVVHIVSQDIYFDFEITHWQQGGGGGGFAYRRSTAAVPEPTTALLLACGLGGLAARRRRS
jgi:hypothetical protein